MICMHRSHRELSAHAELSVQKAERSIHVGKELGMTGLWNLGDERGLLW